VWRKLPACAHPTASLMVFVTNSVSEHAKNRPKTSLAVSRRSKRFAACSPTKTAAGSAYVVGSSVQLGTVLAFSG
jgi:hypothetical protein